MSYKTFSKKNKKASWIRLSTITLLFPYVLVSYVVMPSKIYTFLKKDSSEPTLAYAYSEDNYILSFKSNNVHLIMQTLHLS